MCQHNSSSIVSIIFSAGASQNTAAAAARIGMLRALLWPLLASAPGISYSSAVMEWPCNTNPADDTSYPRVLVPPLPEAGQKELEPLQHPGVGRAEEAEAGAVRTHVPVKFYWMGFLQCSEQAVAVLQVFRMWKGITIFTSSLKECSSAAHLQPASQSLTGSMFALWGSAEAVTGVTSVHAAAAGVARQRGCCPGPVLSCPLQSRPHPASATGCKQHGEFSEAKWASASGHVLKTARKPSSRENRGILSSFLGGIICNSFLRTLYYRGI